MATVKAKQRKPRPKRNAGHDNLRRGSRVRDPIPVAPLREYFKRGVKQGEFTVSEVAERLGWYRGASRRGRKQGLDTTRVERMLGVKGYSPGVKANGNRYGSPPRTLLNYQTAVLLCRAMGAWPSDMRDENDEPIL